MRVSWRSADRRRARRRGSVRRQIAKIRGCRAVGIAGGPDKCHFVVEELGVDACVDHRAGDFVRQLEAACPVGIDVYFENLGGAIQQAVWPLLNDFARIPVCGLISQYSATTPMPGPGRLIIISHRLPLSSLRSNMLVYWSNLDVDQTCGGGRDGRNPAIPVEGSG